MWFGNERCYRFQAFMFSGRYTYPSPYMIHVSAALGNLAVLMASECYAGDPAT
jgi:hypothetical protein